MRSERILSSVLMALLLSLSGSPASATGTPPAQLAQGGVAIMKLEPGSRARLDERELKVSEDGWLLFGVGRDASGRLRLETQQPNAAPQTHVIEITAREFRIERVDGLPPQTVSPNPVIAARIAREQAAVTVARERNDDRTDFAHGFIRPVPGGRISGVYGSQRILNGEPRSPHMGLDIAVPTGTSIRAPAAGVISFAEADLYLTGGTVLLDHGHGLSSSFLHLSRLDVSPGQRVEQGQQIGAVGATGRASGPHLHWGLNWFETRLDPALLLP